MKLNQYLVAVLFAAFSSLFMATTAFAQNADNTTLTEREPSFKGGNAALMAYLDKNVKYPEECRAAKIKGRVAVVCTIAKDGSITKVVDGSKQKQDSRLVAEALRVVGAMPKWDAAIVKGQLVDSRAIVAVVFK
jgi:Gram-negative bacterial TonB protein C-terminal